MPDDAPSNPPRKKPNVLWFIGALFLFIPAWIVLQLFVPSGPVVVSKQTTYITQPLAADGLPDYERYWLEKFRDGVTPENNAAVVIWPALPRGNIIQADFLAVCDEFGLGSDALSSQALQPLDDKELCAAVEHWISTHGGLDDSIHEAAEKTIEACTYRPWSGAKMPPLEMWIQSNQQPLDTFVDGSRRTQWYLPSPTLLDSNQDLLIAMLLPGIQSARGAARGLSCRAMWHLGEGRLDESWRDISAIFRLARLVGQGPTLVEQLVAIACDGIACDATVVLLDDKRLTPQLAQQIAAELAKLAPASNMTTSLDQGERITGLDAMVYSRRYGFEALAGNSNSNGLSTSGAYASTLNWNLILRYQNQWYDRLVAAARMPTRAEREAAFAQFETDIAAAREQATRPVRAIFGIVSRDVRSELIASVFADLLLPALDAALLAEDRGNTRLELTRLAAALARYRIEYQGYPDSLDALVPNQMLEIPNDIYHGSPYIYRRVADGYLLYACGENGTDDGGSKSRTIQILEGRRISDYPEEERQWMIDDIPLGADDISIRVPRPAFKLPRLPASE